MPRYTPIGLGAVGNCTEEVEDGWDLPEEVDLEGAPHKENDIRSVAHRILSSAAPPIARRKSLGTLRGEHRGGGRRRRQPGLGPVRRDRVEASPPLP